MPFDDETKLIYAIALQLAKAGELAELFHTNVVDLQEFVAEHRERITAVRERFLEPENAEDGKALSSVNPGQLEDLWISNKYERLRRMQDAADRMEEMIMTGHLAPAELATAVRELRSYMALAANELGQLLHRGAGDTATGDTLSVEIGGVDMESLR